METLWIGWKNYPMSLMKEKNCTVILSHLQISKDNVLFLVPGDEFQRDKIAEFVSNLVEKFYFPRHTAVAWFNCADIYHPRTVKRILL